MLWESMLLWRGTVGSSSFLRGYTQADEVHGRTGWLFSHFFINRLFKPNPCPPVCNCWGHALSNLIAPSCTWQRNQLQYFNHEFKTGMDYLLQGALQRLTPLLTAASRTCLGATLAPPMAQLWQVAQGC